MTLMERSILITDLFFDRVKTSDDKELRNRIEQTILRLLLATRDEQRQKDLEIVGKFEEVLPGAKHIAKAIEDQTVQRKILSRIKVEHERVGEA